MSDIPYTALVYEQYAKGERTKDSYWLANREWARELCRAHLIPVRSDMMLLGYPVRFDDALPYGPPTLVAPVPCSYDYVP